MDIAKNRPVNVSASQFLSISKYYLELVKHLNQQVTLIENFDLNGGVIWPTDTNGILYFKPGLHISRKVRKHRIENMFSKLCSCCLVSVW